MHNLVLVCVCVCVGRGGGGGGGGKGNGCIQSCKLIVSYEDSQLNELRYLFVFFFVFDLCFQRQFL